MEESADMLSQEQIEQFKRNGYLEAVRAVSDEEADALRERMHEVLEGKAKRGPESNRNLLGDESKRVVHQIVNIWEADDLFLKHVYNERVAGMVSQLMDHPVVRVWHDQIQFKPPKVGGPTDWHQDHPYWPIIQPPDLVSAWMALDDAAVENGCMWMVPGSHLWGSYKDGTIGTDPETFDPTPDFSLLPECARIEKVPCEVKKGHVMFHHCLTWHGSPCNNSERGRPAIAVHYMPGYTRYEPQHGHVMERRVEVKPGEVLQGEYFPTVWDNGPVAPVAVG